MQFLLVAFDCTDPGAYERRMKCRPDHPEKIKIRPFRMAKNEV